MTKCHLCDTEAIAIFCFTKGCYCDKTEIQPLCLHHAYKSGPNNDGAMILLEDLSIEKNLASTGKEDCVNDFK